MKKLLPLLLAATLLLAACAPAAGSAGASASTAASSGSAAAATYQKITAEEAQQMLQDQPDAILLDVRTQEEYDTQHIEGATLLTDSDIAGRAADVLPDKDAVILVYCRSGRRSAASSQQLAELGYTNVYDFGGIIDWPYGVVTGSN
ncbi:Thiosulfate sulfurtransferase GlpE [bioreactor metagenome]|uniref:Thiosulfate sulfurtransferase GlpE n=1 Tax=bioreactor metagenome TaxID=1076179 RepID=A0A645I0W7_9ZZZZ